jgi:hypothetical protein
MFVDGFGFVIPIPTQPEPGNKQIFPFDSWVSIE